MNILGSPLDDKKEETENTLKTERKQYVFSLDPKETKAK